jgi:hypothetical protein
VTAPQKFRNENARIFHTAKDWGWMFSHVLMDKVIAKTGMSRGEVEKLFRTIGREMRELLVTGVPVGLPYSPVIYSRRSGKRKLVGKKVTNRDTARCCVRTSRPFRDEMQARMLDRGTIRAQYDAERRRVTGFKGLAFKPPKDQTSVGLKRR